MTTPSRPAKPPRLPQWLLVFFLSPEHDSVIGDIEEEFYGNRERAGWFRASLIYWIQTVKIIPPLLFHSFIWSALMFKNYFKIVVRNFVRQKGYSFIKLAGLVVGMTCFVLIMLYVQHELSYDRYHENKDRIYRLVTRMQGASFDAIAKVGGAWGPAAEAQLPEVERAVRFVFFGTTLVSRGEKRFYESEGLYADSTIFEVFSFPLVHGDPNKVLSKPHSIVITEDLAKKYFDDEDPIGQSLTFDNQIDYEITGIMKNVASNSHFTFTFLASLSSTRSPRWENFDDVKTSWQFVQAYTYLLLRENASTEAVQTKFLGLLDQNIDKEEHGFTPVLQPMLDIHLHSQLWREMAANSDISRVYAFSAIAFLILLIACTNFMNIASAQSVKRSKEVGIRKVIGANRTALVNQLLGESLLFSLVALLLSFLLAKLLLPSFNNFFATQIELDLLSQSWLLPVLIAISLFVGLMSGGYPAFVLSSFQPAHVFKKLTPKSGGAYFRKGLVIFQFAISTMLLIATGVVFNQLDFIHNKKLGFNKEQLVLIPVRDASLLSNYETVKQELLQHPNVVQVSASANTLGGSDWGMFYRAEGIPDDQLPPARLLVVDHDFIKTYQIEVAQGRDFSKEFSTDTASAIIINEKAAQAFGWDDPLGKTIHLNWWQRDAKIIGVVKDFHFRSLHQEIGPVFLYNLPNTFNRLTVKIRPQNVSETIAFLENKWSGLDPAHPFTYTFFDERFGALHLADEQMGEALGRFAILAILIACLGLFGLASFSTEERTKEIGVRKVLGASIPQIFLLLSKDFTKLVVIAFVLACPLAWFVIDQWLQNFAYRIAPQPLIFIVAGIATFAIALITVSYQSIKTALTNPVNSLQYE